MAGSICFFTEKDPQPANVLNYITQKELNLASRLKNTTAKRPGSAGVIAGNGCK
jgi:hypothetical protein